MPSIRGTVQKVYENEVKTRYGVKNSYRIMVDGNGYSAGFKRPAVSPGQEVEIAYKDDSYRTIVDLSPVGGPVPVAPTEPEPAPAPTKSFDRSGKVFPIPPLHPDRSVVRQNSMRHAASIYAAVLGNVSEEHLNKLRGNGEKLAQEIIQMARYFEAYSCGDLDREEALKEMADAEAKAHD